MDLVLVGQQSKALVAFVPPVSIEDRSLLWTLVRLQTRYPTHILAYGSGKACYSLVMVLALSGPTVMGRLLGRRSKHRTKAEPQVLRAWSPSLDRELDPVIGVE
jgi:hypothetical protein